MKPGAKRKKEVVNLKYVRWEYTTNRHVFQEIVDIFVLSFDGEGLKGHIALLQKFCNDFYCPRLKCAAWIACLSDPDQEEEI